MFVFVAPPSLEDLAKRLAGRATETPEQMQRRLGNAKAEINRCAQQNEFIWECALIDSLSVGGSSGGSWGGSALWRVGNAKDEISRCVF